MQKTTVFHENSLFFLHMSYIFCNFAAELNKTFVLYTLKSKYT